MDYFQIISMSGIIFMNLFSRKRNVTVKAKPFKPNRRLSARELQGLRNNVEMHLTAIKANLIVMDSVIEILKM